MQLENGTSSEYVGKRGSGTGEEEMAELANMKYRSFPRIDQSNNSFYARQFWNPAISLSIAPRYTSYRSVGGGVTSGVSPAAVGELYLVRNIRNAVAGYKAPP